MRPENEGDDYEIWVLTPVHVGTVTRAGTQRVLADGIPYTNLNAAARHILEKGGHNELADDRKMSVRTVKDSHVVTGLDLVAQNAWTKFCERRKINPRSTSDMNKSYQLTKHELKELGIKE